MEGNTNKIEEEVIDPEAEKKEIINTAVELATKMLRQELDNVWKRLQKCEAQTEINTNSNAETLGIVRNHVHEPIR